MKIKNIKLILIFLVISSCIGCDQITKEIAQNTLRFAPAKTYLNNTVRLQYAENTGSMLGLGSNLPDGTRFWLLTILPGLFLLALLVYMLRNHRMQTAQLLAFSFIVGGGFSNLFDRLVNGGRVIDFMNLGIGYVRTGIFNFADVAIMFGLGMLLVLNIRSNHSGPSPESADETDGGT